MDPYRKANTQTQIMLGLFFFAVIYYLGLPDGLFLYKLNTPPPLETPLFGWCFFILPITSLIKKLGALFPTEKTAGKPITNTPLTPHIKALSAAEDKEEIKSLLIKAVQKILRPEFIDLYLYDPKGAGFRTVNHKKKNEILPGVIPWESEIHDTLRTTPEALTSTGENQKFIPYDPTKHVEAETSLNLLVPIHGPIELIGWLILGPREDKEAYGPSDIEAVKSLTRHFSSAYQKTDLINIFQSQTSENEIRNRIIKTVNSAEDLDGALTSIFEHLQGILALHDFSLILRDPENLAYKRVFSISNDQVLVTTQNPEGMKTEFLEKKALATGQITEVVKNGSWLIIPLFSDEAMIGAISLGNRDEQEVFNDLNFDLVRFLAYTVTTAIQIHHLKQENQSQGQQLETINQISEQLTSIMHFDSLLVNTLEAAMNILKCSSGILMVIDEDQDELVFSATAGPVGASLQGERIPSSTGIAGQAYTTREPIISNQIDQSSHWLRTSHPKEITQIDNIMAVPMIAHGHVIGILELINKTNNLPFNKHDQEILERFANLAAVAVHNASDYSETDEALEARVEELYIMQQIDRDLNATQDIDRALQRMLEAALKHTSARVGTIGLIDQDAGTYENIWQIRPGEEAPLMLDDMVFHDQPWFSEDFFQSQSVQSPELSSSFELSTTFSWHYLTISELENDQALLLVLHAESSENLTRDDRAFLTRLKDHGIIALKNVLLYEELHHVILAKNEFIGFISHELKNPLTVIKGYADILRKGMAGEVNEEQIDYLSTINHNVKRMDTFIKDLSDQSHIETKSLRMDFESTPVQEVVNEVLHSYEAQINKKSLEVELNIPRDIPNIWCDRQRMIQVLANLISNAIKYTPPNRQIRIGAEHSANTWDEKGTAEVVHLWVQDDGYGISPKDQQHLFEKFYRGSDIRIKKIPGTGLGLRISKSLVEMMGGKMWFESAVDEGSTFHFTLPI